MKRFRAYKIREMFAAIVFGSFVYPSTVYKPGDAHIQNCILRVIIYEFVSFLCLQGKNKKRGEYLHVTQRK